uniref:Uncharacterized protein n=1 Tax=Globodera rostochiensis TaxID=31243 RepID=A0A914H4C8_GLORO
MQFFIQIFVLLILVVALCSGGGCIGKDSSESTDKNKTNCYVKSGSLNGRSQNSIYYDANGDSFNASRSQRITYHDAQNGDSFNASRSQRITYYDAQNGDSFNAVKFEKVDLKKKEYDKEANVYYTRRNSKRKN